MASSHGRSAPSPWRRGEPAMPAASVSPMPSMIPKPQGPAVRLPQATAPSAPFLQARAEGACGVGQQSPPPALRRSMSAQPESLASTCKALPIGLSGGPLMVPANAASAVPPAPAPTAVPRGGAFAAATAAAPMRVSPAAPATVPVTRDAGALAGTPAGLVASRTQAAPVAISAATRPQLSEESESENVAAATRVVPLTTEAPLRVGRASLGLQDFMASALAPPCMGSHPGQAPSGGLQSLHAQVPMSVETLPGDGLSATVGPCKPQETVEHLRTVVHALENALAAVVVERNMGREFCKEVIFAATAVNSNSMVASHKVEPNQTHPCVASFEELLAEARRNLAGLQDAAARGAANVEQSTQVMQTQAAELHNPVDELPNGASTPSFAPAFLRVAPSPAVPERRRSVVEDDAASTEDMYSPMKLHPYRCFLDCLLAGPGEGTRELAGPGAAPAEDLQSLVEGAESASLLAVPAKVPSSVEGPLRPATSLAAAEDAESASVLAVPAKVPSSMEGALRSATSPAAAKDAESASLLAVPAKVPPCMERAMRPATSPAAAQDAESASLLAVLAKVPSSLEGPLGSATPLEDAPPPQDISQATQATVTIPEGAPPGTILSIPVRGGAEKLELRVPEGLGPGSTLILTQMGTEEWGMEVGTVNPLT